MRITNAGPEITGTDYWHTEHARRGLMYLSVNAGALRLLVPEGVDLVAHGVTEDVNRCAVQIAGGRTSDFLTSVLSNDLRRTIGHADRRNAAALDDTVTLINSAAPAPCWGSPERVREWQGLYQRDV